MNPLFKWAGSKQRMLTQYKGVWCPSRVDYFIDLFAGGLTNSLEIARLFPNATIHINDKNTELINLYQDLANNKEVCIAEWRSCVELWLSHQTKEARKEFYYGLRDAYFANHSSGLLLFMLQVNFNGMWKAYKKFDYLYSTAVGTCLQERSFFKEQNIHDVADFLSGCIITNKSFEEVTLPVSAFVYADPPYRHSVLDYQGGFGEEQHIQLANLLMNSTCKFSYSNKDVGDGFFDKHFDGCFITPCSATYGNGRGAAIHKADEVLITNF